MKSTHDLDIDGDDDASLVNSGTRRSLACSAYVNCYIALACWLCRERERERAGCGERLLQRISACLNQTQFSQQTSTQPDHSNSLKISSIESVLFTKTNYKHLLIQGCGKMAYRKWIHHWLACMDRERLFLPLSQVSVMAAGKIFSAWNRLYYFHIWHCSCSAKCEKMMGCYIFAWTFRLKSRTCHWWYYSCKENKCF